MIVRSTALCADGMRHMVFIIDGYPVGSTACAKEGGVKRETLDKAYETITCVECLSFEHGLGSRGK